MTAILVGSFSLGAAVPGLNDWLNEAGNALVSLNESCKQATGIIGAAASTMDGLANDIDDVVQSFTSVPFDQAQNALDAADLALDKLKGFVDIPSVYLNSVIAQLKAALEALNDALDDAEAYLDNQIQGVQDAISGLSNQLDTLQQQLDDLLSVSDRLSTLTDAMRGVETLLNDAIDAATDAIADWLEALSQLSTGGIYVVHYSGTLANLGSEVDAVLPGTGVPSGDLVVGPLLIARVGEPAAAAIRSAFDINI